MKSVEVRDMMFGEFIQWLKVKKNYTEDRFLMDVWMNKIWDIFWNEYQQDKKREDFQNNVVQILSAEEIQRALDRRKIIEIKSNEIRDKQTEENDKNPREDPKKGFKIL